MPELPEVETIVRTLSPQVFDCRISSITVLLAKTLQYGAGYLPLPEGSRIVGTGRRAKLALLHILLPDGNRLVAAFHLKMTGSFFVHPAVTPPFKHTRLIFDLLRPDGEACRLFFDDTRTFGYCRLMSPEELEAWPFWKELGPEPLETAPGDLAARFAARNAAIKAVLLDQTVVAGVGNIYADESLFASGLAPSARASAVPIGRLERLADTLQHVLRRSIEECGSSIRNYRDANGDAGAFQNMFAVYGRGGLGCPVCGKPLARSRVAGRSTVHCEKCQKG